MGYRNLLFLSYKREDLDDLQRLYSIFRASGLRIWRDLDYLPPGSDTENEIRKAIAGECLGFLVYVTPQSLGSQFIWEVEIPAAYERSRRENGDFLIIPVFKSQDYVAPFSKKSLSTLGYDLANRNGFVLSNGVLDTRTIISLASRLLEHLLRKIDYTPIHVFTHEPVATCAPDHLVLDWIDYFPDAGPSRQDWSEVIIPSLRNVRRALLSKDTPQREIWLPTRVHLSAGLAYGWTFRETRGFHLVASDSLKAENREDVTDVSQFPKLGFTVTEGSKKSHSLFLGVSIAKDVSPTVRQLIRSGYRYRASLMACLESLGRYSVLNTMHARCLAEQTVQELLAMRNRFHTEKTDLLISSSVQYAAYLGWYLNACGDFTYWQYRNKMGDAVPSLDLECLWDGDT